MFLLTHWNVEAVGTEVADWFERLSEVDLGVVLESDDRVVGFGVAVLVDVHRVALDTCMRRTPLLWTPSIQSTLILIIDYTIS